MSREELYGMIDDINSIDIDFEARMELARLAVEGIERMGGICDEAE